MKRISAVAAGLLVVASVLFGCANRHAAFNQEPWGTQPIGSDKAPWVTLIDGEQGLQNFNRVGDVNWLAMYGAIQGDRLNSGMGSGFLVSKNSYTDFQIYAEFWAEENTNSGIFIRATNLKEINTKSSYEVNIFDKSPGFGTGAIVNLGKPTPMPKAAGKWNTFLITAQGPRMTVVMNGEQTVDVSDDKFRSGPFALQYNSGTIKFRKVIVRPL